eukprot:GCRY01001869.1.p1 GENE.GCRY01001869.1~~GCRY01001869.1.p1  ORF type:complete len:512 (+),score=146.10 GCRY01001869.1:167-1702(+)
MYEIAGIIVGLGFVVFAVYLKAEANQNKPLLTESKKVKKQKQPVKKTKKIVPEKKESSTEDLIPSSVAPEQTFEKDVTVQDVSKAASKKTKKTKKAAVAPQIEAKKPVENKPEILPVAETAAVSDDDFIVAKNKKKKVSAVIENVPVTVSEGQKEQQAREFEYWATKQERDELQMEQEHFTVHGAKYDDSLELKKKNTKLVSELEEKKKEVLNLLQMVKNYKETTKKSESTRIVLERALAEATKKAEAEAESMRERLSQLRRECNALKQTQVDLQAELTAAQPAEKDVTSAKEVNALRAALAESEEKLKRALELCQEQSRGHENELVDLKLNLSSLHEELLLSKEKDGQMTESLSKVGREKDEVVVACNHLQKELAAEKQRSLVLQKQLDSAIAEKEKLQEQSSLTRTVIHQKEEETLGLQTAVRQLQEENQKLKYDLSENKDILDSKQQQISALETSIGAQTELLTALQKQMALSERSLMEQKKEAAELQADLAEVAKAAQVVLQGHREH